MKLKTRHLKSFVIPFVLLLIFVGLYVFNMIDQMEVSQPWPDDVEGTDF